MTMNLLSLVLGVIGGALGVFSIVVTWNLYKESNKTHLEAISVLREIKSSTSNTEVTATRFTERLVEGLLVTLSNLMSLRLGGAEKGVAERIRAVLENELPDMPAGQRHSLQREVLSLITDAFGPVRQEAFKLARAAEVELPTRRTAPPPAGYAPTRAPITAGPSPDLTYVIRWIAEQEPPKNRFLSVKNLREKRFAQNQTLQDAFQSALNSGMLETYYVDNPRNPEWPTKACRVNRTNETVKEILALQTGEIIP